MSRSRFVFRKSACLDDFQVIVGFLRSIGNPVLTNPNANLVFTKLVRAGEHRAGFGR